MSNNYKLAKVSFDWEPIEKELKFELPNNYKEFYETFGAVGIDDFIYIVPPEASNYGLKGHIDYVQEAYLQLEQWLEKEQKISLFNGVVGWLPVGYTTNGDFIFVDDSNVLVTDSAFEEKEIYKMKLIKFIERYLENNLNSKIFPDDVVLEEHSIEILKKESIGYI